MELTLLTTPACPHREVLERRLAQALAGRAARTVRHEVADEAEARRRGLRGSPTLLTDGADPFALPGETAGLWCRLYLLPDGSLDGAPSVGQLRAALNACAASGWGATSCGPRSSPGRYPSPRGSAARPPRAAGKPLPRAGWPLAAYILIAIALLGLAASLPVRDALIAAGWLRR